MHCNIYIFSNLPLELFGNNEAIQCTEIYEYALALGNAAVCLHNFQVHVVILFIYPYLTIILCSEMSVAYIQVHFRVDFIIEANTINPDQTAPKDQTAPLGAV